MKILFLDFDEVINSLIWFKDENNKWKYRHKPNQQAIQWVSEFCEKYGYKIVISSSCRVHGFDECVTYLRENGLRESVEIIDMTPRLYSRIRGEEISAWLDENPDIEEYIIFDDDSDMTVHMDRLIKTDVHVGFTYRDYLKAVKLINER